MVLGMCIKVVAIRINDENTPHVLLLKAQQVMPIVANPDRETLWMVQVMDYWKTMLEKQK